MLGDALCYDDSEGDSDIEDKVEHGGGRMEELVKKKSLKKSRETEKDEYIFMQCFAKHAIKPNIHTLTRVCLSHCYIGDCGLKSLLNELKETSLTYVNFSWNHCTP